MEQVIETKKEVAKVAKVKGVKLVGVSVNGTEKIAKAVSDKKPEAKTVAKAIAEMRTPFLGGTYLHAKKDRKVQVISLMKNCPHLTGLNIKYLDDNSVGKVTYKYLAPIAEKASNTAKVSATK